MKRFTAAFALFCILTAITIPVSAQTVTTWIQPRNVTTNQTLLLGQNQVLEVISISLDTSTALDITIDGRTLTFGTGGVSSLIPHPLVVAGPAKITMRRPSAGDDGSMITFRVVEIENQASQSRQMSAR